MRVEKGGMLQTDRCESFYYERSEIKRRHVEERPQKRAMKNKY